MEPYSAMDSPNFKVHDNVHLLYRSQGGGIILKDKTQGIVAFCLSGSEKLEVRTTVPAAPALKPTCIAYF
jgi:hypothetical protein